MSDRNPVFAGIGTLVEVIRKLYERPRPFTWSQEREIRGDHPLPIIYLQHDGTTAGFLRSLETSILENAPDVPVLRVDAATAARHSLERWRLGPPPSTPDGQDGEDAAKAYERPREPPLLPLLDEARDGLSVHRTRGRRLSGFTRYRVADLLTGTKLEAPRTRDDKAEITAFLKQWAGGGARAPDGGGVAEALNRLVQQVASSPITLMFGLFWLGYRIARLSRLVPASVPGLARESHWFMRRQAMVVPKHSRNFLDFATRLTVGHRKPEMETSVKKLLVHAFLEDLRVIYRRRHFKVFPRLDGYRRTGYVVLLIGNATADNGAGELLGLINSVRNETGDFDPLLVIAAGEDPPPEPIEPGKIVYHPAKALLALQDWWRHLPDKRQTFASDARHLPFRLPPAAVPANEDRLPGDDLSVWRSDAFACRRALWLTRSSVLRVAGLGAVAVLLFPLSGFALRQLEAGCALRMPRLGSRVSVRAVTFGRDDVQCVGYSADKTQIFGSNERLRLVQKKVLDENEAARRSHAANPGRPYIGLVFFAAFTHKGSLQDTDHAVSEELEGLLLRQRIQNGKSSTEPLLEIIIANGGEKMREAPRVTRDMLLSLFRRDPRLLGVVGLDRTVVQTEEAITMFGGAGVPAFGTTLTGTGLEKRSPLYFQMVPSNRFQAILLAEYARSLRATRVVIYHPLGQGDDTYIGSLVKATKEKLREFRIPIGDISWADAGGDLHQACDVDRHKEIAFFAGRENEFSDFLRAITGGCADRGTLPAIVADDAISRFVANAGSRRSSALAGIPVSYVSLGSLLVLADSSCSEQGKASGAQGAAQLASFCSEYGALYKDLAAKLSAGEKPGLSWPAERVGLTFDAAGVFIDSVLSIRRDGPWAQAATLDRAAVAQRFREPGFASTGVTGLIDFVRSRAGDHRNLALLRIANIHDINERPVCVFMIGELYQPGQRRDPRTHCPVPGPLRSSARK
ncbi:hypothetical protein AGRA3207_000571 [Actinomadura graeca]|uniref:ABC transporter substrate-binding protein n=1 Tax=Actinomadura graeca TaxID=2750812 RepID=A0ABX8QP99_9ACTN|nr:hypothetical protein [Actinomadura graeca]QXJ19954.1 hypothetical protein AGRA3207_000571 [Actinomadura graeca]